MAGVFVAVICQISIAEISYKIRYQAGLSCVMISPCHALVRRFTERQKSKRFYKVVGGKFINGNHGGLFSCSNVIAIFQNQPMTLLEKFKFKGVI